MEFQAFKNKECIIHNVICEEILYGSFWCVDWKNKILNKIEQIYSVGFPNHFCRMTKSR
jgi:hypothetical protein